MMDQIVQDALDELEFCLGDVDTQYGALRAAYGHPEPFKINFVEIGNEDWFSSTYPYRFQAMYDGLKAAYPNITYVSSAFDENPEYNITIPAGNMWDWHMYAEPSWFLTHFDMWDNWQEATNNTDVGVLLGEYSVIQIDTPDGNVNFSYPVDEHVFYPRLLSALCEGVYLLAAERNPNTVKMASYAASLENRNYIEWSPSMISFDAAYNNTVRSASYWWQHMFSHHRGTQTLPVVASTGQVNPLYWVASINEPGNCIYLKVINTLNASVPLNVDFGRPYGAVNGTILTAPDLNSYNYIDNMTVVYPQPIDFGGAGQTGYQAGGGEFSWDVPRFSVNVLQFDL